MLRGFRGSLERLAEPHPPLIIAVDTSVFIITNQSHPQLFVRSRKPPGYWHKNGVGQCSNSYVPYGTSLNIGIVYIGTVYYHRCLSRLPAVKTLDTIVGGGWHSTRNPTRRVERTEDLCSTPVWSRWGVMVVLVGEGVGGW